MCPYPGCVPRELKEEGESPTENTHNEEGKTKIRCLLPRDVTPIGKYKLPTAPVPKENKEAWIWTQEKHETDITKEEIEERTETSKELNK